MGFHQNSGNKNLWNFTFHSFSFLMFFSVYFFLFFINFFRMFPLMCLRFISVHHRKCSQWDGISSRSTILEPENFSKIIKLVYNDSFRLLILTIRRIASQEMCCCENITKQSALNFKEINMEFESQFSIILRREFFRIISFINCLVLFSISSVSKFERTFREFVRVFIRNFHKTKSFRISFFWHSF